MNGCIAGCENGVAFQCKIEFEFIVVQLASLSKEKLGLQLRMVFRTSWDDLHFIYLFLIT